MIDIGDRLNHSGRRSLIGENNVSPLKKALGQQIRPAYTTLRWHWQQPLLICLLVLLGFSSGRAQTSTLTALTLTPRLNFTPTPPEQKGYWNIDVVGDFYLPSGKSMIFHGAGRNLHVGQDREKIFRRGFTAVERTRMTLDEQRIPIYNEKPAGWKSPLKQSQRALVLTLNYFYDPPYNDYNLYWAKSSTFAPFTYYNRPTGDPLFRNSLGQAIHEMGDECMTFGDCPPSGHVNTYKYIFMDIENEGTPVDNRQEQVNLYVYMMKALRDTMSTETEIGSIAPVAHNSYGFTRDSDYLAAADWLWTMPARQTPANPQRRILSSRDRGMPDAIVGKSFSDYTDFQMPGVYNTSLSFNYTVPHSGEYDSHWLAALLGEQEVNVKLSPQKRIAWQWLFNTQSSNVGESNRAEFPAPPAIAEGTAIFYWFTGADGVLFWDDAVDLKPNRNTLPADDPLRGLDSDRNYACYEHYLQGLCRLFKNHGDLFDGNETYLNQQTECSFDNGRTWHRYNAGELKRSKLPYARAIVNKNQILIAATQPYASPGQKSSMRVRYQENGYRFETELNLTGDEILLGQATMTRHRNFALSLCGNCPR